MATIPGQRIIQPNQPTQINSNTIAQIQIKCKTSVFTYLLAAIFILNIAVIIYIMRNDYLTKNIVNYSNIMAIVYYSLITVITIKFKCSPMTSLLFHPAIFVVVFSYIVLIGLHGLSNLYFLSQTEESSYMFDLFKHGISKANNYVTTKSGEVIDSGVDVINRNTDAVIDNIGNVANKNTNNVDNVERFLNY